jgi:hypothetical protein
MHHFPAGVKTVTIAELRKIADDLGLKEADRLLSDHAAKVGRSRCDALYAEFERLRDEPPIGPIPDRPSPPETDRAGWDGIPWLVGAVVVFMAVESVREGHYLLLAVATGILGLWIGSRRGRQSCDWRGGVVPDLTTECASWSRLASSMEVVAGRPLTSDPKRRITRGRLASAASEPLPYLCNRGASDKGQRNRPMAIANIRLGAASGGPINRRAQ